MTQITWKNINAPSLTGAMEAQTAAAEQGAKVFDPLEKLLTGTQAARKESFETERTELREDTLGQARLAASQANDPVAARAAFDAVMVASGTKAGFQAESQMGFEEKGLPAFKARLADETAMHDQQIQGLLFEKYQGRVPTPEEMAQDRADMGELYGEDSAARGRYSKDSIDAFSKQQMDANLGSKKYADQMAVMGPQKQREAGMHDKRTTAGLGEIDTRHGSAIRVAETAVKNSDRAISSHILKADNTNIAAELAARVGGIDANKIQPFLDTLIKDAGGNVDVARAVLKETLINEPPDTWWRFNDIDQSFKTKAQNILGRHLIYNRANDDLNTALLARDTEKSAYSNERLNSYESTFVTPGKSQGKASNLSTLTAAASAAGVDTPVSTAETPAFIVQAIEANAASIGSPELTKDAITLAKAKAAPKVKDLRSIVEKLNLALPEQSPMNVTVKELMSDINAAAQLPTNAMRLALEGAKNKLLELLTDSALVKDFQSQGGVSQLPFMK